MPHCPITKREIIVIMNNNIKVKVSYGVAEIDPYPVPPLLIITECPIMWTLSRATCKKHAKNLAASIILGQPFNRKGL